MRKWQMHNRLKPFSVGKFMLHGCDPQEYAEFFVHSSAAIWLCICGEMD
jgi:hypothetical protein